MSKTTARAQAAQTQRNPSTQAQPVNGGAAQPNPAPQADPVLDLTKLTELDKEVSDLQKKQSLMTSVVTKLSDVVKCHDQKIDDLDQRVKVLEGAMGTSQKTAPASQQPTDQPDPQQATSVATPVACTLSEGPTEMYKYWDSKHGCWAGPKQNLFAAKVAGNGIWEPVWVWTKGGKYDHLMSSEEVIKYCP